MKKFLYIIEYEFQDSSKSFIVRSEGMSNAEAWHWACCDAGLAVIPRSRNDKIRRMSKPMAERHGLENVKWRPSGDVPYSPMPYCPPPPE